MKAFLALLVGALLLTSAPALAQSASRRASSPQPTIVDSTEKVVGPMVDGESVLLSLPGNNAIIRIGVKAEGFVSYNCPASPNFGGGCIEPEIFYTTSDCSGPGFDGLGSVIFVYSSLNSSTFRTGYVTPDHSILFQGADVSVKRFMTYRDLNSTCQGYPNPKSNGTPLHETIAIDSLGFTPPFKVVDMALSASPQPILLDGMGKTVGPMIDGLRVVARIPSEGKLVAIAVDRRGLTSADCDAVTRRCQGPYFEYTSADCSGRPYLRPASDLLPFVEFNKSMSEFSFPGQNTQQLHLRSYAINSGCVQFSGDGPASPAQTLSIEALGFVPPFTVKLDSSSPQPVLQDGSATLLGPMLDYTHALLDIPAIPKLVRIGVRNSGFWSEQRRNPDAPYFSASDCSEPDYYFTTSDCTGTKYLLTEGFITDAQATPSNAIVYPGLPVSQMVFNSAERNLGYKHARRRCVSRSFGKHLSGPAVNMSLESLGITLPYRVVLR